MQKQAFNLGALRAALQKVTQNPNIKAFGKAWTNAEQAKDYKSSIAYMNDLYTKGKDYPGLLDTLIKHQRQYNMNRMVLPAKIVAEELGRGAKRTAIVGGAAAGGLGLYAGAKHLINHPVRSAELQGESDVLERKQQFLDRAESNLKSDLQAADKAETMGKWIGGVTGAGLGGAGGYLAGKALTDRKLYQVLAALGGAGLGGVGGAMLGGTLSGANGQRDSAQALYNKRTDAALA